MQRKPGYPVANCNIRMPDNVLAPTEAPSLVDEDSERRRLQLINFAHSQWGFNNWSWAVTKQDLDFVDFANGKYAAGVVAFVTVTVKSFEIHRENIGYATAVAPMKGSAIYQARKGAVTNALRETLLSFGGSVATELMELIETLKPETTTPPAEPLQEINQNLPKPANEQRRRKESPDNVPPPPVANIANVNAVNAKIRSPHPMNAPIAPAPPVARAAPMPAKPHAAAAPHVAPHAAVTPHTAPHNAVTPHAVPHGAGTPHPAPHCAGTPHAAPHAPTPLPPHAAPPRQLAPQRNSNEKGMEGMTEEEARAERKRRQRQAQEEFRLKQMAKKTEDGPRTPDKSEFHKSTFDKLLSDISTPEVVIQETGDKRKSPEPGGGAPKRRAGFISKLDIVQGD